MLDEDTTAKVRQQEAAAGGIHPRQLPYHRCVACELKEVRVEEDGTNEVDEFIIGSPALSNILRGATTCQRKGHDLGRLGTFDASHRDSFVGASHPAPVEFGPVEL